MIIMLAWAPAAWAAPVKVVATFSILGDVARNVAGDKVEVGVIVGANGDAHTFEPTPRESIMLARADVILENGLGFEPWLNDLYSSSGSHAGRVTVTEGIEPRDMGRPGEIDPHVWQDVSNVMVMVELVRDALTMADPANAAYYRERAESYLGQLATLDHWVIDTLKDIPDEKRKLVTSHDTLGYFAKRYGFAVIATLMPSASTEAQDPSAKALADMLGAAKEAGVNAIFTENTANPKLADTLAKEAGIALAPPLYTDALGAADSDGNTYINMMRHNVNVLAGYLK